jgi:hypothetical protein
VNPVLGSYGFTLQDLRNLTPDELERKEYTFFPNPSLQGVLATVSMGFVLDAPVSGIHPPSSSDAFRASQIFDDNSSTGENPVFLNTSGPFSSFLFFGNAHPLDEESGQVVPYDSRVKSLPSDIVML